MDAQESVALGDAPLAPCAAGAIQIRLGGGDITGVHARPGLLGGGDDGDLELGVDPTLVQKRVNGDCLSIPLVPRDASISAIHEDGTVSCNTDEQTDVIAGFRRRPGRSPRRQHAPADRGAAAAGREIRDPRRARHSPGRVDGQLRRALPATRRNRLRPCGARCQRLVRPQQSARGRLSPNVVHEFKDAGKAVLSCASFAGAQWHTLKITAIAVASLSNAPLTLR